MYTVPIKESHLWEMLFVIRVLVSQISSCPCRFVVVVVVVG